MNIDVQVVFDKITGKIQEWIDTFIAMIPNMLVSILLFILFYVLARITRKVFIKLFNKTSSNKALENLFSTIVYYVVIGLGLFVILGVLKLEKTVTSLLAGVGVIGLALGFAFQDVAANFISGIILAFRRPFVIGDIIEVNDQMGKVTRTNLRVTVIETFQGQEIYIPNKEVIQSAIINYSVLGQRRIDLNVGISYGDDLQKVEELVKNAISKLDGLIRKDDMIFDYYEFGDSSINFNIRFWVNYPDQPGFLIYRNRAIKMIKHTFDENDITIPFPIRTLDFGIKGGERLADVPLSVTSNNNQKN
ncbi:MAG: mechanosensitive ion channel [Fulvivirga sp.]|nr:mechanosensitive ion channel [Fulvivirga sp.]